MKNIKNIIFDYGNVIFNIDFRKAQQGFGELGIKSPGQFFGHLQQDPVFDELDRGDVSAEGFRAVVRHQAGNPNLTDAQIDEAWNSLLLGVAPGTHELLLKLKEKYRTFLLSNNNEIHYRYILNYLKKYFGLEDNEHLFEKTYYSHLERKRKPDPIFFEQVLKENNLTPEETLFIDDSPQHLAAAETLGLKTFLMTAPDTLADFVAREQLL